MPVDEGMRRISIDVPEDLYQAIQRTFPWGTRNTILTNVLSWLVGRVEKHGIEVLGPLLNSPEATSRLFKEPTDGNDR